MVALAATPCMASGTSQSKRSHGDTQLWLYKPEDNVPEEENPSTEETNLPSEEGNPSAGTESHPDSQKPSRTDSNVEHRPHNYMDLIQTGVNIPQEHLLALLLIGEALLLFLLVLRRGGGKRRDMHRRETQA